MLVINIWGIVWHEGVKFIGFRFYMFHMDTIEGDNMYTVLDNGN